MKTKITKSKDKHKCGVCGWIADYLDVDPTVVRLLTATLTLLSACLAGIFLYFITAIIIPNETN